ncbi:MAG: hypothetical protein DDT21_00914 [Syntrophomonadaceae bacterium]|nr:hypothetical protein [Bacillota bacterium]
MATPRELKALYEGGTNISAYLRREKDMQGNTTEIIDVAYDLQAGSYIDALQDAAKAKHQQNYTAEIARNILSLLNPRSILEAGVGEATTLSGVLSHLGGAVRGYGFDLSWSRVAFAKRWLRQQNISDTVLCTGNLLHIPFADDSIDIVYTSHTIEPNSGKEEQILRELFRVAKKFLILLEPSYELAGEEAKQRMDSHGYCKNLLGTALSLGYKVMEHRLFPFIANPLNPTALTIIRKDENRPAPSFVLACPKFKTPLHEIGGMLFSSEALTVYPIIGEIPCLRIENGVFASKYQVIMEAVDGVRFPVEVGKLDDGC